MRCPCTSSEGILYFLRKFFPAASDLLTSYGSLAMKALVQRQACIPIISIRIILWLHKVRHNSLRKGEVLYCGGHIFFPIFPISLSSKFGSVCLMVHCNLASTSSILEEITKNTNVHLKKFNYTLGLTFQPFKRSKDSSPSRCEVYLHCSVKRTCVK